MKQDDFKIINLSDRNLISTSKPMRQKMYLNLNRTKGLNDHIPLVEKSAKNSFRPN